MTASAWLMLILTWTVIVSFTGRFFWRVLTLPQKKEKTGAGPSVDDAEG